MFFSYLPKVIHLLFILIILISFLVNILLSIGIALTYVFLVFMFRKIKVDFRDDQLTTKGLVYSPVSGRVLEINSNVELKKMEGNFLEIKLKMWPWNEMGIHLPFTSEVKSVVRSKPLVNSGLPGTLNHLDLEDINNNKIRIKFHRSFFGGRAQLQVSPGDRGRRQVNIGFLPVGGIVSIYISDDSELMVKVGEDLKAAQSVLAGLSRK